MRGLVLGKFMPPHRGHQFLVDFARHHASDLAVVVESVAGEPIPSLERFRWMQELAPGCRVLHLEAHQPQAPDEHPDFWNHWRRTLLDLLPWAPDVVYTSDAYGKRLAEALDARWMPVDPGREALTISGTAIRADPFGHWSMLPPCVRPWFAQRVCVFGPESSGKTTLARHLADALDTVWVPEFARGFLEAQDGEIRDGDFERIARGQRASEAALARQANRWLVCDTDALSTRIWSEMLTGRVGPQLEAAGDAASYALTLLCMPEIPFEPDPVRYLPDQRDDFLEVCRTHLRRLDRPFVEVSGSRQQRLQTALDALDAASRSAPRS